MSYPYIPNKEYLEAIGSMCVKHGHMEYILKMTIRTFSDLSVEDALRQTNKQAISEIRKRIIAVAKEKFGDTALFYKLEKYMEQSWKLSDIRNPYIHGYWAEEFDNQGNVRIKIRDGEEWIEAPSLEDIKLLHKEIEEFTWKFNDDRLLGEIAQALAR